MSRVKEAIFDIIKPYLEDAKFLDLFSGTGNMALEALSRGVKRAVMIEKNKDAVSIIIENVNSMGFEDRCRAYKNEVNRAIEILSRKREIFDIIFIDPPYKEELCTETITKIDTFKILSERGSVFLNSLAALISSFSISFMVTTTSTFMFNVALERTLGERGKIFIRS